MELFKIKGLGLSKQDWNVKELFDTPIHDVELKKSLSKKKYYLKDGRIGVPETNVIINISNEFANQFVEEVNAGNGYKIDEIAKIYGADDVTIGRTTDTFFSTNFIFVLLKAE